MVRFLLLVLVLSPLAASGRSEGAIQKSWDYPDIHTVIVDADQQDVVVSQAEGTRVSGRLVGESGDEVKVVRSGATLTVTVRSERSWFAWRHRSSRIELSVPAGLSLDLTTASGALLVQASTAVLVARSASGDIEAPRGGESVNVDSTSGTLRLRGFRGSLVASSLSGDLLLEDSSGLLKASTLSGSLRGRNLHPGEGSRFTTVSGVLDLDLAGGAAAYSVRSESVSGRIEVTPGQGPGLFVQSVSGDIRVP
jgi:hypothetical protein